MKKVLSIILCIVALLMGVAAWLLAPYAVIAIWGRIEDSCLRNEIIEYVLENKDQIEVTETRQTFPYAYTGLAIAGVEYGYYYDAEDRFEMKGTPYRNGFRRHGYPDEPTDWYYTERICENWFYYEVHDG